MSLHTGSRHIMILIARFMGPTWSPSGADRTDPCGPHVGPINFAIWGTKLSTQSLVKYPWWIRISYRYSIVCMPNDSRSAGESDIAPFSQMLPIKWIWFKKNWICIKSIPIFNVHQREVVCCKPLFWPTHKVIDTCSTNAHFEGLR